MVSEQGANIKEAEMQNCEGKGLLENKRQRCKGTGVW
jgi:hypothetical protein